jgi:hypothetical protein
VGAVGDDGGDAVDGAATMYTTQRGAEEHGGLGLLAWSSRARSCPVFTGEAACKLGARTRTSNDTTACAGPSWSTGIRRGELQDDDMVAGEGGFMDRERRRRLGCGREGGFVDRERC